MTFFEITLVVFLSIVFGVIFFYIWVSNFPINIELLEDHNKFMNGYFDISFNEKINDPELFFRKKTKMNFSLMEYTDPENHNMFAYLSPECSDSMLTISVIAKKHVETKEALYILNARAVTDINGLICMKSEIAHIKGDLDLVLSKINEIKFLYENGKTIESIEVV